MRFSKAFFSVQDDPDRILFYIAGLEREGTDGGPEFGLRRFDVRFENLVQEGGMQIITDPDDDVFIDENKSLIK